MERRVFLVFGGLGVVGSEAAEQLLGRGEDVVVCDSVAGDDVDVVNGATSEEKRRALARLSAGRGGKFRFSAWFPRTCGRLKTAIDECGATDVLLFGLCGRQDGGALAYTALADTDLRAIVASSAAVYDTSFGGGRRGGSSARTHARPLLSEGDAHDDGRSSTFAVSPQLDPASTWRVEHAVARACQLTPRRPKVGVLRYFGVFGGRHKSDWPLDLLAQHTTDDAKEIVSSSSSPQLLEPQSDDDFSVLGMRRLGAYGCADFCGVTDAADAALRTADALHSTGLPGATLNVGVGRAHRAEHVCRAVGTALSSLGLAPPRSPSPRTSSAKSCPGLGGSDARAGFAAADVSKLRALVGWVPSARLDLAVAKELAKSIDQGHLVQAAPSGKEDGDGNQQHATTSEEGNDKNDAAPTTESSPPPTPPRVRRGSASSTSLARNADEEPAPSKNRSLAALDLSSCAATNLLQVSVQAPGRAESPRDHDDSLDPFAETDDDDAAASFARTHQKNHRFFQLNQFTAIPPSSRSSRDDPKPGRLKALFAQG
mmetsp:Transcript_19704/g.60955  ORF Transcript_19704/g.60955 Transcript_19704/m.60955 type:complete len:542 (-) Transcript_19704:2462-4087(-)